MAPLGKIKKPIVRAASKTGPLLGLHSRLQHLAYHVIEVSVVDEVVAKSFTSSKPAPKGATAPTLRKVNTKEKGCRPP